MKYCKECNRSYYSYDNDECEKCKKKLVKGTTALKMALWPNEKKNLGIDIEPKYVFLVAVIALSVGTIFAIGSTFTGAHTECTQVQQDVVEEVPYEAQGVYLYYPKYQVLNASFGEEWNNNMGFVHRYVVELKNDDTVDGYFSVRFLMDTTYHGKLNSVSRKLVSAGSSQTFEAVFDTDIGEKVDGKHEVVPEPVERFGSVVKYRNETVTKTIMRCL